MEGTDKEILARLQVFLPARHQVFNQVELREFDLIEY